MKSHVISRREVTRTSNA